MAFTITPTGIPAERALGTPAVLYFIRTEFQSIMEQDMEMAMFGTDGQDFAEKQNTVIYTHVSGEIGNYSVIFDKAYASQGFQSDTEFNGLKPQFMVQETKLLRSVQHKDTVSIRGNIYNVEDYHSDGVGVTTVYLRLK